MKKSRHLKRLGHFRQNEQGDEIGELKVLYSAGGVGLYWLMIKDEQMSWELSLERPAVQKPESHKYNLGIGYDVKMVTPQSGP